MICFELYPHPEGEKRFTSLFSMTVIDSKDYFAKPFVLPLQIFATITNNTTFSQNSNENTRNWGYLAAPVAAYSGRKLCV